METGGPRRFRVTPRGVTATVAGVLIAGALALVTVAAGIGLAALVGELYDEHGWDGPAHAGESFGVLDSVLSGLAFAALIVTLWIQFRELQLQRQELHLQRKAIEESNTELRRTADAEMRKLHLHLLKLSLEDAELSAVWPVHTPGLTRTRMRQHLYANLIFQHVALSIRVGGYTEDQVRQTLRWLFGSELMRDYWRASASARLTAYVPNTDSWNVERIGDEVYAEYEGVESSAEPTDT
jgi:hypothetical protein